MDKLTQEEARMASAELLKMTHSVDSKVMGVNDRFECVEGKMQDVHDDVQVIGNKVQDVDGWQRYFYQSRRCRRQVRLGQPFVISLTPHHSCGLNITGSQLRDNLLRWLSPPDPPANHLNHNIACKAHTACKSEFLV